MFIELINGRGEKVFTRTQEIRLAKVEKLESSYCCNFIIGDEYCYSEATFDTEEKAESFIKKILK